MRATGELIRSTFSARLLTERWWTTSSLCTAVPCWNQIGPWQRGSTRKDWEYDSALRCHAHTDWLGLRIPVL